MSDVGVAVTVGMVTVRFTVITCEVAPVAATVKVPVKLPAVVKGVVFTEMLKEPGVVPVVGLTTSHAPPVVAPGVTV